jgi:hypothetical protein
MRQSGRGVLLSGLVKPIKGHAKTVLVAAPRGPVWIAAAFQFRIGKSCGVWINDRRHIAVGTACSARTSSWPGRYRAGSPRRAMKTKKTIGPTQRPNPVGFKPLSTRRLRDASRSARRREVRLAREQEDYGRRRRLP